MAKYIESQLKFRLHVYCTKRWKLIHDHKIIARLHIFLGFSIRNDAIILIFLTRSFFMIKSGGHLIAAQQS